ncbi:MAG: PAS domain S-box protein [Sedimentisphaerales bacterium]|nr:PAS domain S-box protein [Sedimentisphaerales bacterium]
MTKNKEKYVSSSFLQWTSILVAIALAVLTLLDFHEKNIESRQRMREDIELSLEKSKQRLTQYIDQIATDLRIISMHPDVINLDSSLSVNTNDIFADLLDDNYLSAIYIFKSDFDGKSKPFKVLKKDSAVSRANNRFSETKEEYSTQLEHLRNFSRNPSLELQFGSMISLRTNEKTTVISRPIRKEGLFIGMISGMIPVNRIVACIGSDSNKGMTALINGNTEILAGKHKNNKMAIWLNKKLNSGSASDIFRGISNRFKEDGYSVTTVKIKMPGTDDWYFAHIHDEADRVKANGSYGVLSGYGTVMLVLLLGLTGCMLSKNQRRRQEAEAELIKAHALLELRVMERTRELSATNKHLKREISERIQAEEALLLKQFSLDKTAESIFWINPEGHFVDVNKAACNFLGYTREQLLKMSIADIDTMLTEDLWPKHWERLKEKKSIVVETEHRTKEGVVFPVEVGSNYVNYNGQEYNFSFAHEITERKKAEDTLRKTNQELREYTRLKNDFVITVSHELRTPLAIFKNIISNMLAGVLGTIKNKQREALETANKEIDRLAKIVSDFLDISKLEAGKMKLSPLKVDIRTIINDAADLLRHLAKNKNIELIVSMPQEELIIDADYDKIIQVMTNLLDNAIKFVPNCAGCITIGLKDLGESVEVSVEDNGYGVESDDISKVFNRFVQVNKQVGPGAHGTGLGLAVCKELVELHNGRIWVENTPDGGANFCFTLPKVQPEPEPAKKNVQAEQFQPAVD